MRQALRSILTASEAFGTKTYYISSRI